MHYDLCLMDVNMPVMDGIEAIREIRKNTLYLPVVAHSADPDNEVPCFEAGADEFLLKPRSAVELKRTLEDFSVKQMILYLEGESLSMCQVGPVDREELTELRMLNKKGMTKFTAVDISFRFLAHKNAQNKLLEDFGKDNFRFAEILDRTYQGHNVIQIHASQIWLKKTSLTPEEFQKRAREEDALLKKYEKP